ncbi:MAG: nuclear transport factor 2 family protein [Pseudomonadota bacterium]
MNRTEDAAAVHHVMNEYVEGTRTRDIARLKAIFHENAVMTGYLGPDFLMGGPEPFYGALEASEVGADYAAHISEVSVTGATAQGRIVEDNLLGLSFVNDFHLAKADGAWKIVSKLFHHDAPEG